jgi:arylformamidase
MHSDIIDISQPIGAGTPVWPGDTPFSMAETWSIGDGCPVQVSRMTLSTHTGTHADAHAHYAPGGTDSAARELAPYIGPCVVVDVSAGTGKIGIDEVMPALARLGSSHERVLLRSFSRFPLQAWPESFRAICPDLVEALAARGCCLVGTDAPSIDPQTCKTLPAHHAVHRHNMAILEGLVLDHVAEGCYELIALPLRIEKADASPVRAVLRPL